MPRSTREGVFMDIAFITSRRSTCLRAQVGAVIVRDGRIISMGYNGAPPGMPHCLDVGCKEQGVWKPQEGFSTIEGCTRAIHAEANSIAWAARVGVPTDLATMYCTHLMCVKCAELVVSAGILHVRYFHDYRIKEGLHLLKDAGIGAMKHGTGGNESSYDQSPRDGTSDPYRPRW